MKWSFIAIFNEILPLQIKKKPNLTILVAYGKAPRVRVSPLVFKLIHFFRLIAIQFRCVFKKHF